MFAQETADCKSTRGGRRFQIAAIPRLWIWLRHVTYCHDMEEFLTVHEVAALLRVNQQTVRNWIDAGSLPAVRAGRRVRIAQATLEELLGTTEISPEALLTVDEVAARLRLNQQTIRNAIDHGQLGAVRIGRRVRIRLADLDAYTQSTTPRPATEREQSAPAVSAEDFWLGTELGETIRPLVVV